ncbi:MAG: UvrD-helicase domain-containing protein, partial [Flammeovirgaceae bacterium]
MNFKIYRSSAGSGKTYTLTKEYLKLALAAPALHGEFQPTYFQQILAVTFTNDAANEMKERILHRLAEFAQGAPDEFLLEMMVEEMQVEYPKLQLSKETLLLRAKKVHEALLHNYSDFSVSTIDSFNNRVVQSFKKDLQLPFNYEIELDTSDLREEAANMLQNRVQEHQDSALNDLLVEFAIKKADDGNNWYINADLEKFANNLFHEEKYEVIEKLSSLKPKDFKRAKEDLFAYLKKIEDQVKASAQKAVDLINQHQINLSSFARGRSGIGAYFEKHSKLEKPLHTIPTNSYVQQTVEKNKWTATKAPAEEKSAIEFISGDLAAFYQEIEAIKERERSNYTIAHSLRQTIYLLATINELDKHVESIKEQKNLVHIADFNRKINRIVEEEPVPYIYERLGERYMHILIDEFQDTSRMQWHNLIPLVVNALGFGMQNLVVGDAKQAIYRWRGGKSEMLVKLPHVPTAEEGSMIQEQVGIFHIEQNIQVLEKNFRSRQQIIEFNNAFFTQSNAWLSGKYPALGAYFAEVAQLPHQKKGGHVQLDLIDKCVKADFDAANLARVIEIIEEVEAQGYQKGDIAILTRTNLHGAYLAEKLLEVNIPVVSSESLLVGSSAAVRFIVDFFKLLHQPLSPILKVNLALSMQRHFSSINPELQGKTTILGKALKTLKEKAALPELAPFNEFINAHFNIQLSILDLQILSIYETAEELIRICRLNELEDQQVYIQRFLDFILEFNQRYGNDVEAFLEYWERKESKLSISTPKSNQAVRIMTIHKSKGLQFPIVIVPFAEWGMVPKAGSTIWKTWDDNQVVTGLHSVILKINKELAQTDFSHVYDEEMQAAFVDAFNLLYVAFTRPESKLYVISKYNLRKDGELKDIANLLTFYMGRSEIPVTTELEIPIQVDSEAKLIQARQYILKEDYAFKEEAEAETQEVVYPTPIFLHTQCRDQIRVRRNETRVVENKNELEEIISARKQGVLVHYAFEKIRYRNDIPKAAQALVNEGLLAPEEVDNLTQQLTTVVDLPEIKRYFTKGIGLKVYNEKEVLIGNQESLQILRPDRIVFDGDQLIIMDYKTGTEDI